MNSMAMTTAPSSTMTTTTWLCLLTNSFSLFVRWRVQYFTVSCHKSVELNWIDFQDWNATSIRDICKTGRTIKVNVISWWQHQNFSHILHRICSDMDSPFNMTLCNKSHRPYRLVVKKAPVNEDGLESSWIWIIRFGLKDLIYKEWIKLEFWDADTEYGVGKSSIGVRRIQGRFPSQMPPTSPHKKDQNSGTYTQRNKHHFKKSPTAFLHSTVAHKKSIALVKTPCSHIHLEFKLHSLRKCQTICCDRNGTNLVSRCPPWPKHHLGIPHNPHLRSWDLAPGHTTTS